MVMHRYTIHCKLRVKKAHHLDKNVDIPVVDDFNDRLVLFLF